MAAWVSAYSDLYDCRTCKRRGWTCKGATWGDVEIHERDAAPIFAAARNRICPRALLNSWTGYVHQAQGWFESGQLGMTFIDAPPWISEAFGILTSERARAEKFRRENGKK